MRAAVAFIAGSLCFLPVLAQFQGAGGILYLYSGCAIDRAPARHAHARRHRGSRACNACYSVVYVLCALNDLIEASEHHQFGLILPFEIPTHILCAATCPPHIARMHSSLAWRSYLVGVLLYALGAVMYLPHQWIDLVDEPVTWASRLLAGGSLAVLHACVLNGAHIGGAFAISDAAVGPRPPRGLVLATIATTLTGAAALLVAAATDLGAAGAADLAAWLRAGGGACFAAAGAAPILGAWAGHGLASPHDATLATPATPTPRKPISRRYPSMD